MVHGSCVACIMLHGDRGPPPTLRLSVSHASLPTITFPSQIKAFGHGGSPLPWVKQPSSPLPCSSTGTLEVCSSALGIHGTPPRRLQKELHVRSPCCARLCMFVPAISVEGASHATQHPPLQLAHERGCDTSSFLSLTRSGMKRSGSPSQIAHAYTPYTQV